MRFRVLVISLLTTLPVVSTDWCYNQKCKGKYNYSDFYIDCDQSLYQCEINYPSGYPECMSAGGQPGLGVFCYGYYRCATHKNGEAYCKSNGDNGKSVMIAGVSIAVVVVLSLIICCICTCCGGPVCCPCVRECTCCSFDGGSVCWPSQRSWIRYHERGGTSEQTVVVRPVVRPVIVNEVNIQVAPAPPPTVINNIQVAPAPPPTVINNINVLPPPGNYGATGFSSGYPAQLGDYPAPPPYYAPSAPFKE
jgi:hypothetical protein